jgi:FkbM family methyltransferase
VIEDLVYDVGMHNGKDTAILLQQGFRVVAIEANPVFALEARERFRSALDTARLHLIEAAVAAHDGSVDFFVCDSPDTAWSTMDAAVVANRTAEEYAVYRPVQVAGMRFEDILFEHGVPYYLKIDIEGSDTLCLRALHAFEARPRYISLEIMREHAYEDLVELAALGYTRFKLVNQGLNADPEASSPFGDDAPGSWVSLADILPAYRNALELTGRDGVWFDLHAARESDRT